MDHAARLASIVVKAFPPKALSNMGTMCKTQSGVPCCLNVTKSSTKLNSLTNSLIDYDDHYLGSCNNLNFVTHPKPLKCLHVM